MKERKKNSSETYIKFMHIIFVVGVIVVVNDRVVYFRFVLWFASSWLCTFMAKARTMI